MPTYVYRCSKNAEHEFEQFETINRRDEVQQCHICGGDAHRVIVQETNVVYKGNDWTRKEGREY